MVENLQHLYDFSFLLNASGLHLFLLESVSQSRKSHSQEDIWPVFSFVWFHPITSGYIHVVYSPKQFFSSMAVCVLHTGITNFPSHYHPFILSPFINQSLQPLYHLCCWSSLIPVQLVIISSAHGYPHLGSDPLWMQPKSHHGFICLQTASKTYTESVTWHGSESDLVLCVLSVPSCSAVAICFSPQTFWWSCVSQVSFFCLEFQHLFLLGSLIAAFPRTLINGPYKYRPWSIPSNLSTSMDGFKYLSKTTTCFRAILFQFILFVFSNTLLNVSAKDGN